MNFSRLFKVVLLVSELFGVEMALGASLSNGKVSFLAKSNAFDLPSNEIALTGEPKLVDGLISGTFKVDLVKFESGNETRDKEMRGPKVLDVKGQPLAELKLDPTSLKASTFTGQLKFRGITRPVKGKMEVSPTNSFKFSFTISCKDFGIDPPSLIAVYMQDSVDIVASGDVKQ